MINRLLTKNRLYYILLSTQSHRSSTSSSKDVAANTTVALALHFGKQSWYSHGPPVLDFTINRYRFLYPVYSCIWPIVPLRSFIQSLGIGSFQFFPQSMAYDAALRIVVALSSLLRPIRFILGVMDFNLNI